MSICGLDFGTSNTTLGTTEAHAPVLAALETGHTTIPSAIFYPADGAVLIGRKAVEAYVDGVPGRLMRSLKSVLGTALIDETTLMGRERTRFRDVIGYYLGEPYWNRGFMSEAAAGVIEWYFGETGDSHLDSGAFAFNKASLAVQKKLGFTEMRTGRKHCLARDEDLRHIDTRLTRARWDERRHGADAKETT